MPDPLRVPGELTRLIDRFQWAVENYHEHFTGNRGRDESLRQADENTMDECREALITAILAALAAAEARGREMVESLAKVGIEPSEDNDGRWWVAAEPDGRDFDTLDDALVFFASLKDEDCVAASSPAGVAAYAELLASVAAHPGSIAAAKAEGVARGMALIERMADGEIAEEISGEYDVTLTWVRDIRRRLAARRPPRGGC